MIAPLAHRCSQLLGRFCPGSSNFAMNIALGHAPPDIAGLDFQAQDQHEPGRSSTWTPPARLHHGYQGVAPSPVRSTRPAGCCPGCAIACWTIPLVSAAWTRPQTPSPPTRGDGRPTHKVPVHAALPWLYNPRVHLRRLGLATKAVLLLALAAGHLVAERPAHAETGNWFALHTWGARHGLPESAVRGLLQDRDGYLWVATVAGLARFDGVRFIVFDDREHGPLKEIELQAMAQAADGSIWIASFGGGITRLHQGKFTTFTKAQGLGGNFATSLVADRDGAIWAGTDEGLSRWKDGQIRTFTTGDGLPESQSHPLYSDVDGSLLLTKRSGGLLRYAGGKFSPADVPGLQGETTVRALLRDRSGALWIATHIGLFQQKDGQTRHYTAADGLATTRVASLAEDSEGNLWIGTDGGLTRYRDGVFETHAVADFNGRGVTALTASREGGVFVGSGTVTYVRRRQFRHYGQEDGLPHYMATTFFQDSQGTLWIGTIRGLASLRDGKVTSHSPDPIPGRIVGGIIEDRAGHLWVGSDTGLYRSRAPLAQGPPALVRVPDQPARTIETRVMFLDRDGTLWIGAVLEGLVRYQDGAFTMLHHQGRSAAQRGTGHPAGSQRRPVDGNAQRAEPPAGRQVHRLHHRRRAGPRHGRVAVPGFREARCGWAPGAGSPATRMAGSAP